MSKGIMCPHDGTCENDVAVRLLGHVFDETWVKSFIGEGNPALVDINSATSSYMPVLVNQFSTVALTVALLVLCGYLITLFLSSTNDGEIKGVSRGSGSFLGSYGRPLFAVMMLLPTPSGYPVIAVLIMSLVLNSNGMANKAYQEYADRTLSVSSLLSLDNNQAFIASNSLNDAAFYGAIHGYCAKSASEFMSSSMRMDSISTGAPIIGERKYGGSWVDTDSDGDIGQSAISGDLCGTFETITSSQQETTMTWGGPISRAFVSLTGKTPWEVASIGDYVTTARSYASFQVYRAAFRHTAGESIYGQVSGEMDALAAQIMGTNAKSNAAVNQMTQGVSAVAAKVPTGSGWPIIKVNNNTTNPANDTEAANQVSQKVSIGPIVSLAKEASNSLNSGVKSYLAANNLVGGKLQGRAAAAKELESAILSEGWLASGSAKSRLSAVRRGVATSLYSKTTTYAIPNHTIAEDTPEEFKDHVGSTMALLHGVQTQVVKALGSNAMQGNFVASASLGSNPSKLDPDNYAHASYITNMILAAERSAVQLIVGTDIDSERIEFKTADSDILSRMQDAGETFASIGPAVMVIKIAVTLIFTGIAAAAEAAANNQVAAFFGGGAGKGIVSGLQFALTHLVLPYMEEVTKVADNIATMLGVVVPTLPFLLLTMAGVGWFLQVIMTMFGMPLFLIMHALPGDRFMGSQQQGYVTLLALFFRPLLIVTAFFLAFLIYEPLVIYFTRAFFFMRGNLAGAASNTGLTEALAILGTIRDYWYIYSTSLILMTYLIFGLVQEMGDNILDWLGTNLLRNFGNLNSQELMNRAAASALKGREEGGKSFDRSMKAMDGTIKDAVKDKSKTEPDADKAAEARQNQMDNIAGDAKALGSGASSAPADKANAAKAALADGKIGADRADGEFNATADSKEGAQGGDQQDKLGGENIDTAKADGVDTNDATDEGPVTDLNDNDGVNSSGEGQDINTDGVQDGAKGVGGEAPKATTGAFARMLSKFRGRSDGSALGGAGKTPGVIAPTGKDASHIDNKTTAKDASRSAALGATGGDIPLDRKDALPASAHGYSMKTNADGSVTESYKHKDASGNELSTTATTNADGSGKLVTTGTDSQGREFSATSVFGAGGEKLSTETTGFNESGAAVTRTESFDDQGNVSAVQESVASERGKYTTTTESHADGSTTVTAMGVSGNGSFTSKETYNAAGEMTSRSETAKDAAGNTEYSITEARSMNGGTNTVATGADGKTTSRHNPNGVLKSNSSTAMGAGAGSVLSGNAAAVALNSHRPLDLPSQNNGGGSSNVTGGTTPSGAPLGDTNGAVLDQANQGAPAGTADSVVTQGSASTTALGTGTSDGNAVGGADVGLNAAQGGTLVNPNSYMNSGQDAVLGGATAANSPTGGRAAATAVTAQDSTGTPALGTGAATPVNGTPVGSNSHTIGQSNVSNGTPVVTNTAGGQPTTVSATAGAVGSGTSNHVTSGAEVKLNTTYNDTAQHVASNGILHSAGSYTNGGLNLHNAGSPVQQGGDSTVQQSQQSPVQIAGGNAGQSPDVATTQVTQVTGPRVEHVGAQAVHTGGSVADRVIATSPVHLQHSGAVATTDRSNAVLHVERNTALGTAKTSAPPNHLSAPQSAITVALHNALSGGHSGGNNPVSGHFNPLTQAVTASPVVANRHNLVVSQSHTDVTSVQQPSIDSTQTTTRATVIYDDANSSASDAISINQAQTSALSVDFTRVTDKVKALPMMADPEPSTPDVQIKGGASHDGKYSATDRSSFGGALGKIAHFIGLGKKE